jgi:nitrite reductase/ring-hydroxylating ferredoxin subunit
MAEGERLICPSAEVAEGGAGFRFVVHRFGREEPAFAVRFRGRVYAYMNRCGHVPVELDWQHGEFFDHSKLYLICATHGALYAPESGQCLGGRCNGKGLEPVPVEERDGNVYVTPIE